jgi:hypothetical protein
MTRREILSGLVAVFGGSKFAIAQQEEERDRANLVSLIRLIANPGVYDGRRVRLAGYIENNGIDRSVGIYLSESDGRNFLISNSIDLKGESTTTLRKFVGKYVLLNATFHAPKGNFSEFWNGYLARIGGMSLVTPLE